MPNMVKVEGHSGVTMGRRTIGATAGSLETAEDKAIAGVVLKADASNSGTVYVGNSNVTTSNGFPLTAGQSLEIQADSTAAIWVVGSAAGQIVHWIALLRT